MQTSYDSKVRYFDFMMQASKLALPTMENYSLVFFMVSQWHCKCLIQKFTFHIPFAFLQIIPLFTVFKEILARQCYYICINHRTTLIKFQVNFFYLTCIVPQDTH